MLKVGDKVNLGELFGEVAEVHKKTKIGFGSKTEVSYDIVIRGVSEEIIRSIENGTN